MPRPASQPRGAKHQSRMRIICRFRRPRKPEPSTRASHPPCVMAPGTGVVVDVGHTLSPGDQAELADAVAAAVRRWVGGGR